MLPMLWDYVIMTSLLNDIAACICCRCKQNIEEEEAAAEAKVRSMLPQDAPHPSLGILPPNPEVLIHVQAGGSAEVGWRVRG